MFLCHVDCHFICSLHKVARMWSLHQLQSATVMWSWTTGSVVSKWMAWGWCIFHSEVPILFITKSFPWALQTMLAVWHWMAASWDCMFIWVFHSYSNFDCCCILFLFLEEDRYDSYSRMILKYFLAEGVVCRHELFVAAAQDNPDDILQVWGAVYFVSS